MDWKPRGTELYHTRHYYLDSGAVTDASLLYLQRGYHSSLMSKVVLACSELLCEECLSKGLKPFGLEKCPAFVGGEGGCYYIQTLLKIIPSKMWPLKSLLGGDTATKK